MATHAQNIQNLRNAVYGEQVRGSMIELFEEDYNLVKDGVGVGTVISSASDPTTGFSDGAVYINSSTWHLFKLEGAAWADKGIIQGTQGESVVGAHDNGDGTFYLVLSDGTHTADIATIQGIQGPQGPQGIQGVTGPAGRDVTSITMSGTGKSHPITATYSDGSTQTVGVVQDGADGTGAGDMTKAVYDRNDHGYVDAAAGVTDGTNTLTYTTLNNKANKATSLAGYNIADAYTMTQSDGRYMQLPASSVTAGKVPISDGSSGVTWQTHADATYNKASTNAQSGVAVEQGIENSAHEIIETLTSSVSAGSEITIPAPTSTGGGYTYNYDYYINNDSIIIPIAEPIDNKPVDYKTIHATVGLDAGGNICGKVEITFAQTLPAGHKVGVLVINR